MKKIKDEKGWVWILAMVFFVWLILTDPLSTEAVVPRVPSEFGLMY